MVEPERPPSATGRRDDINAATINSAVERRHQQEDATVASTSTTGYRVRPGGPGHHPGGDPLTRKVRVVALSVVTIVSLTGCGAAQKVLGIDKGAPTANAVSPQLTAAQANVILDGVFTAAHEADTKTGAAANAAAKTAYSGEGLRRAIAQVKLAKVRPAGSSLPAKPQPKLLAISRGLGYPRVIVAQSVPSPGALPILHLLTCPDAATPYRISASVTMLPLSTIKPFNALNQGSPLAKAVPPPCSMVTRQGWRFRTRP